MIFSPYFSIITPVKNGEKYVGSFMNSLLNQSFQNWEIIIVDDSSDDNSYNVLKSYEDICDRLMVVSPDLDKSFQGPYAARNYAMNFIRGKYVLFWDIDDYWEPCHLYNYFQYLSSNREVDLLYSSYVRFKQYDISCSKSILGIRLSPPTFFLHFLLYFCNPIPMLTVCVKYDLLESMQFQPVGHEDFLFWNQLIGDIPLHRISKISCFSAYYRESSVSQSSNKVQSLAWIFHIYGLFGYSKTFSFFACILFGAYQCIVAISSYALYLIRFSALK